MQNISKQVLYIYHLVKHHFIEDTPYTSRREKEGWKDLNAYYKRSIIERVLVNFNSVNFRGINL